MAQRLEGREKKRGGGETDSHDLIILGFGCGGFGVGFGFFWFAHFVGLEFCIKGK